MNIENVIQSGNVEKVSSLLKEVYQLHVQLYSEIRKWKRLFKFKCEENAKLLQHITTLKSDLNLSHRMISTPINENILAISNNEIKKIPHLKTSASADALTVDESKIFIVSNVEGCNHDKSVGRYEKRSYLTDSKSIKNGNNELFGEAKKDCDASTVIEADILNGYPDVSARVTSLSDLSALLYINWEGPSISSDSEVSGPNCDKSCTTASARDINTSDTTLMFNDSNVLNDSTLTCKSSNYSDHSNYINPENSSNSICALNVDVTTSCRHVNSVFSSPAPSANYVNKNSNLLFISSDDDCEILDSYNVHDPKLININTSENSSILKIATEETNSAKTKSLDIGEIPECTPMRDGYLAKSKLMKINSTDTPAVSKHRTKCVDKNLHQKKRTKKTSAHNNSFISKPQKFGNRNLMGGVELNENRLTPEAFVAQTQDFDMNGRKIEPKAGQLLVVPETLEMNDISPITMKHVNCATEMASEDNDTSAGVTYQSINNASVMLKNLNAIGDNINTRANKNTKIKLNTSTKQTCNKIIPEKTEHILNAIPLNTMLNCGNYTGNATNDGNKFATSNSTNCSLGSIRGEIDIFFKSQDRNSENIKAKNVLDNKTYSKISDNNIANEHKPNSKSAEDPQSNTDNCINSKYTCNNNSSESTINCNNKMLTQQKISYSLREHKNAQIMPVFEMSPLKKISGNVNLTPLRSFKVNSLSNKNIQKYNSNVIINRYTDQSTENLDIDQLIEMTSQSYNDTGINLIPKNENTLVAKRDNADKYLSAHMTEDNLKATRDFNKSDMFLDVQMTKNDAATQNDFSDARTTFYDESIDINLKSPNSLNFSTNDETNFILNRTILTPTLSPEFLNKSKASMCREQNRIVDSAFMSAIRIYNKYKDLNAETNKDRTPIKNNSEIELIKKVNTKSDDIQINVTCSGITNMDETRDSNNDITDGDVAVLNEEEILNSLSNIDDSFYTNKRRKNDAGYAHVEVIRKKSERDQLMAVACKQCIAWFDSMSISKEERFERMKHCRHKFKFEPPSTPEQYWTIGFPDTQLCKEKGYMAEKKAKPSKFRRRKQLRKMF